jgi:hypothetical protein
MAARRFSSHCHRVAINGVAELYFQEILGFQNLIFLNRT